MKTFTIYLFIAFFGSGKHVQDDKIKDAQLLQLDFETIRVATNNFSPGNQLGEGGFGAVYKVTTLICFLCYDHEHTFLIIHHSLK